MHNGVDIRAPPQQLGVQRQLVGDRVAAVELAFGGGIAVEVDQPDVVGFGVREATLLGTPATDQELVLPRSRTDVAEDSVGEAAAGQDPAGHCDGLPLLFVDHRRLTSPHQSAAVGRGSSRSSSLSRSSCTPIPDPMPRRQASRAFGQFTIAAPYSSTPSVV